MSSVRPAIPPPDDDDDDDICPVCDGQCTCNQPAPPPPPLKIKLTVRPRLDDHHRPRFPTFVSASVLSSRASSSDDSDLSSFDDSDSSIEAEEENFIVSQMEGRARVRRELFGDDVPNKKRDPHNAWVIRPRKKSVGPSDVEMDVDSDATEEEEEEEDDDDDADPDEEETDERATGVGYVGLATGWTEDEDESSFDADLFFANLSDSEDHASSLSDGQGDDGDHSDIDSMVASITSLPSMPPELEVQERWDGQIVFTNGLREGQGMLDVDFEAHAASFAETSPSPDTESDVYMSDVDDGGYEEDADEGDGETTDEELVGQDDLPNERAMRLFMTPFSVSAINPMSTMSPAVSPGPRDRHRSIDSPKPADILSGRVFWDSDDHDEYEESAANSWSQASAAGHGPRRGHFVPAKDARQAIIDDQHKDIPSPHPRFRRRRPSLQNVENILQRHLAIQHSSPAPSPARKTQPDMDMDMDMAHAEQLVVDLDDVLEPSILDFEPASADTPSNAAAGTSTGSSPPDSESRRLLRAFNRWDVVSVGAFRQRGESRAEVGAWASDAAQTPGCIMKSSPLSAMLWQNKSAVGASAGAGASVAGASVNASAAPAAGGGKTRSRRAGRRMNVVISPVLLPVRERERDGDRTPTNNHTHAHVHQTQNQRNSNEGPHKTRKELRRERKLKRKSYGPAGSMGYVANLHQHQHQRHQHQHHPNMKTRSMGAVQRSGFLGASVPPLNI